MSDSAKYRLIFRGIGDDHPETLRRVKTVLVADLGYSSEEAKAFLEKAPVCIKCGGDPRELSHANNLLEAAGALVMIEGPDQEEAQARQTSPLEEEEVFIEFDLSEEDQELSLSKPVKKKPPKIYTLDEPATKTSGEAADEIDELLSQVSAGALLARSTPPEIQPPPQTLSTSAAEQFTSPVSAEPPSTPPFERRPSQTPSPPPIEKVTLKETSPPPKSLKASASPPKPKLSGAEKINFFRDILYASGLGMVILGIGYWFIQQRSAPPPQINLDQYIAQIEKEKKERKSTSTPENIDQELILKARQEAEQYTLEASFTLRQNIPAEMTLTITTPKPPELTPSQIVRGEPPPPWLERVSLEALKMEPKPDGSFLAKGNAKLLIKSPKGAQRAVATAVVTAVFNPADADTLTAKVLLNSGFERLPENNKFIFERGPQEKYLFFAALELTAHPAETN